MTTSSDVAVRIKSFIPTLLWRGLRSAWYSAQELRFARYYVDGLLFDLLDKEYRTDGLVFHIPKEATRLAHRARFRRDTHERDERDMAKRHIHPDAVVLELGACLGVVSCVINRLLTDRRNQVAVEASPLLIDTLERNRDQNGCGFIVEQALVSRSSDGTFYLSDCFVMSSGDVPDGIRIQVPVTTVEQLEAKHGRRFDTVFMDIQGGEYGFFCENAALLSRLRTVILELHPHLIGEKRCQKCRDMLAMAGLVKVESLGLVEAWARA